MDFKAVKWIHTDFNFEDKQHAVSHRKQYAIMLNIPLQEAKDKLPELINLVEQGEEIFILADNEIKIKLVSFTEKPKKRLFGQHLNKAVMSDDFNHALPDSFWLGNNE